MARPTLKNTERQAAPTTPRDAAPIAPRRAPEAPRRAPLLESSIITSAPELAADPSRSVGAPRPGAAQPPRTVADASRNSAPAAPEPNPLPRAPLPSLTGEAGLGKTRARKDRAKSPGFYSNMAPAYGAQAVSSTLSQSALKRTVVGVAPPPERPSIAAVGTPAKRLVEAAPALAESAHPGTANGAAAGPVLASGQPAEPLVRDVAPGVAAAAESRAPPQEAASDRDELEKEQTAPGVGHTPSRHDPTVREIPEHDLDLLVQFSMDLALGLATEEWLAAARDAVERIKAAAARLSRGGLDKALSQLRADLDMPNALTEERRGRIMQQLVLVDLALPRPIDVAGRRQTRERLIVQHLLNELSVAHPLIAQRLRDGAGVSLERLARSTPSELGERVGLSTEQAELALASFRDYLDDRGRRSLQAGLAGKGPLVAQRLAELESSAELFERVSDGDDAQAKRDARRRRQADIARVSLLLAEWGEALVLAEFERSSVQGKITRLRRWLTELPASSRNAASAPP